MQDLTIYSNDELSNQVFNDEYFWSEREDPKYLFALISEEFITTKEQRGQLVSDLTKYNVDILAI